ncbi:hypothetical protein ciss_07200 [Carboxydothermus islandicus]|uniref:Uncharacterized protein n=1 Tax=Carboxydothermus islandicus TaxID=661089 RepID=A0A1L8D0Y4_9THEO|nr:hypothetical protein [Carboxydothermus islandicus]GAV24787.1 hypothetical protein ciss_07200 [Carboxydothermus islandicus]
MGKFDRVPIRNVKHLKDEERLEEASELQVTFDPNAFKWFNYRPNGMNRDIPMLMLHNAGKKYTYLRLNKCAIEKLFGENPKEPLTIEIGIAPRAIAIRKAVQGLVLIKHAGSKSMIFTISGIDLPWIYQNLIGCR